MRPAATSYTIADSPRGTGDAAGCTCVQLAPSHSHVSPSPIVPPAYPPKSTVRWMVGSYATEQLNRAGGLVAGNICTHCAPSNSHVWTAPVIPAPKTTTRPRVVSNVAHAELIAVGAARNRRTQSSPF